MTRCLDRCLSYIDVKRVIYGWSADQKVNEWIVRYLEHRQIEKYFWLPIFGEIHNAQQADPFVGIGGESGHAIENLCEGESFDFVCQSSQKNIIRALSVYEQITEGLPVEGVFLDRIRYASAANGQKDLYGCWCSRCRRIYEEYSVDIERVQKISRENNMDLFLPTIREKVNYRYQDPDIDALMYAKRCIINNAVSKLCAYFRKNGKKVGIDTFAMGVADFVGQDILTLGQLVDFVKPMFYLKTNAPAGISFEVDALGEKISRRMAVLFGRDPKGMDEAVEQIAYLLGCGINVIPGIDINRIEGICEATPKYVKNYLKRLEEVGCREVVLSWDAMKISDDVLNAIKSF